MYLTPFKYLILACCGATCFLGSEVRGAIVDGGLIDMDRFGSPVSPYSDGAGYLNTDRTYGGSLYGGEFRVTELNAAGNVVNGGQVFKTFCLEYSEHISLGGNYVVTIDGGAIQGGLSGASPANYDAPSGATQWLYAAYRTSSLDDYTTFQYDNPNWADALQLVFWRLEGEVPTGNPWQYASGNANITANATSLWTFVTAYQSWFENYENEQVAVLNLWNPSVIGVTNYLDPSLRNEDSEAGSNLRDALGAYRQQSQLYYSGTGDEHIPGPVPEPGSLVAWSGFALLGFIAARRRQGGLGGLCLRG
jgi:hypothetical protein